MELIKGSTMSSLELARVTGKNHKELLRSMRGMEIAWENTTGRKFALTSYTDKSNRQSVMYALNKSESLYVISKFKDEIRAKVILRWEALEKQVQPNEDTILLEAMQILNTRIAQKEQQLLLQEQSIKEAAPKVEYCNKVLQSESTYVTNQIAKELGMSARSLNKRLREFGVQYNQSGTWVLYSRYEGQGYTKTKTHHYYNSLNEQCTSMQTVWTEKGRMFIHDFFKHKDRIDSL